MRRRTDVVGAAVLVAAALLGLTLVALYPDAYQQDGGTHFLLARWAWADPKHFVAVWGRPLFTTLYALPARLGYAAAKSFTVAIAVVAAWQSWRYAEDEGLGRAVLAIPFLWLQPSFLLLSDETMTEPLCALLVIIALRLKHAKHGVAAAAVMSATVLARPEGPALCAVWAAWLLLEPGPAPRWRSRLTPVLALAIGPIVWWAAAFAVTHDVAFIKHDWPPNWAATRATYGRGLPLNYFYRRSEIIAPLLQVPFACGVLAALIRRRLLLALGLVVAFFVLHSVLWAAGAFGSAGYPRYFVCVAPAIAVLTLAGWNVLVDAGRALAGRLGRPLEIVATTAVLALSALTALTYVDGMPWTRDSRLIDRAYAWFRQHPEPVRAFAGSQADMWIQFGYSPALTAAQPGPARTVLATLRSAPHGTLVVWDADTGPAFFDGVTADSIIAAGYTPLWSASDSLYGRLIPHLGRGSFFPHATAWSWDEPRVQHMWLLYK